MSTSVLHPDPPLLRRHTIDVGGGHALEVQEFGAARGIPALVLHGGPGSGCSPLLRRFFDPARYRIVCIDQRGAGASRPRGSIADNTTADLLDDLHVVRRRLGIGAWLLVGGSWGATLALAHAAAEPAAVNGLLLRSSFLARRDDVEWFFQGAAAQLPTAWARFAGVAPAEHRAALLPWLASALNDGRPAAQRSAAIAWWHWERALAAPRSNAEPTASGVAGSTSDSPTERTGALSSTERPGAPAANPMPEPEGDSLAILIDRYRVQSHYLLHDCWLAAPTLLERCEAMPQVPTLLLHARDDAVCRPEGAIALHARLPHSELRWVDGAGHDPAHPAMAGAMLRALARYAAAGDFGGSP